MYLCDLEWARFPPLSRNRSASLSPLPPIFISFSRTAAWRLVVEPRFNKNKKRLQTVLSTLVTQFKRFVRSLSYRCYFERYLHLLCTCFSGNGKLQLAVILFPFLRVLNKLHRKMKRTRNNMYSLKCTKKTAKVEVCRSLLTDFKVS